jgi:3-hydroxybutyryl-CoA dehydratase
MVMLDNMLRGTICIEDLEIGMSRDLTKTIEDYDIRLFADISTDRNPVHLDEIYAQETIFGGRIAHGMLTAALISAVIGEQLPGAPVRPGDDVTARVTVREIDHSRRRVTLDCVCLVGEKAVLKGDALVLAPSKKFD